MRLLDGVNEEAESRCVLVSASTTRADSACDSDQTSTRAMWFCNGSRHEALTRLCVVVVVVVVDVMVAVAVAVAVVVLLRWCC